MSKFRPLPLSPDTSLADPRVREKVATWMKDFHREQVAATGSAEMLRVYCQALNNWILNPTTDAHHIEMLVDEICHTAQLEDPDSE
ncbi:hypothetical protein J0X19_03135 [Hymenobacter sp. BT186]|uniref:Uncharacterized protein n=1 Tax=Hymenobacter telluris TaxID=2816474 RepID=A0A939ET16_9BACT|nr:hypothetical protein [Hymenobacter telluris]MBO0356928.1 hypothetical protein [Hymenobacter telluris]MBW3372955.1 hypothetical protein [Hymenobacter norwichensis]